MTAAILQIAQWSAENQPYSLALWVVLAGLLYWAWAWAAHMWEARQRVKAIRDAMDAREAREMWYPDASDPNWRRKYR